MTVPGGGRLGAVCATALVAATLAVAPAAADTTSLKAGCATKDAADGDAANGLALPFRFCDDGVPATGGTRPNQGAVAALTVPGRYDGYAGLPARTAPDPGSGADANGDVALDADVSLPDPARFPPPPGGYPLVVLMHTCCAGDKRAWEADTVDPADERWHYNNAWFASRGYAVLTYTARGFVDASGRGSTGQSQLSSRRYEVNDMQYLACTLAGDAFFRVDPRRVVVSGGSYGGALSWLALTDPTWGCAAAGKPGIRMRLAASAPRYSWTDLLYSLVPNGAGRRDELPTTDPAHAVSRSPLGFPKQSVLAALFATGVAGQPPSGAHTTWPNSLLDAVACLESGDPYEQNPLCQGAFPGVVDQVLEDSSAYYQQDFFAALERGRIAPVPVFSVGSSSPLFSQLEHRRMVERLKAAVPRYPVQEYYGDVGDFTQNKVKEWTDITTRLNGFVDHYARPPGNPDEPTPQRDVTAALTICPGNADDAHPADGPGERFTAATFAALAPNHLRLSLSGDQTTTSDAAPNHHAAHSEPISNFAANGGRCFVETTPAGPGVATYDAELLASDATMIGQTRVVVPHTGTGSGIQLNARLYDVAPDGEAQMVDRGASRVPGPNETTTFDLNGNGWRFPQGHRIRIELAQDDDPYVRRSNQPSTLTLHGVTLDIPVR